MVTNAGLNVTEASLEVGLSGKSLGPQQSVRFMTVGD